MVCISEAIPDGCLSGGRPFLKSFFVMKSQV